MRFERRPRCVERLCRPTKLARNESDLGLGDDAPCLRHGYFPTEAARSTSQESFRSYEIAELRHRDAAKGKRWRIVAQCDSFQCSERITRRERPCCRRDQRVHRNPATLVTPTLSKPGRKYIA
jgi:hypothetical protein